MNIALTEEQQEAVILTILKRDLQNVQEELADCEAYNSDGFASSQSDRCKKHIKMLKRAINFYSVTDEY